MRQLQLEHAEWIAKKYPNQTPKIPAVGCLEEAGELVHAILKIEQVTTWGEDRRHKLVDLRWKLVDALGDCGIYTCSLCNANNWNFEELWYNAIPREYPKTDKLEAAIMLVKIATDVALFPHMKVYLLQYVQGLLIVARCLSLDAETAVRKTWLTVKER